MESPTIQTTVNMTSAIQSSGFRLTNEAVLAAAMMEILIALVGAVGNLFTIIAVLRNRNLQYATNYFIVSLAVADLLVSTILVPMRASQHIAYQNGDTIPKTFVVVAGFVGRVNIIASISTLVCLSVDRYLALSLPLRYATSIRYNLKKVLVVIATIWTLAAFITSLPKFPGVTDVPFLIFFVVFVLTATLVICLMYYQIFKIVKRSLRGKTKGQPVRYSNHFQSKTTAGRENRVANQPESSKNAESSKNETPAVDTSIENKTPKITSSSTDIIKSSTDKMTSSADVTTSSVVEIAPSSEATRSNFSQERKAATTIGLVIVAFFVFVYPRIIMILFHFGNDETASSKVSRFWMRVLLYSNSAINPLFYAYRHRGFRNEFKRMCMQCLGLGTKIRDRYATTRGTQGSQSSGTTFYA